LWKGLSRGHAINALPIILAFLLSACDSDGIISGDATTDERRVDPVSDWSDTDPCGYHTDSDGDTIADSIEGRDDFDGDTLPNYLDPDSDGDTIPDSVEAGDDDLCTHPVNSDWGYDEHGNPTGDELPDFLDPDSDDDGLPDRDERLHGTDPTQPDTDHDTFSDLAEVATGSDPLDPASVPPEGVYVIILPYMAPEHEFLHVRAEVSEGPVDVQGLAVDVPDDPPEGAEYDSTVFVKDLTPYEGFPTAPEGFSSMDETTFHDVVPGTLVQFELDLYNNTIPPMDVFLVFRVWIDVVGEGSIVFNTFEFVVIVPTERYGWFCP
jgi:hypothetical protein